MKHVQTEYNSRTKVSSASIESPSSPITLSVAVDMSTPGTRTAQVSLTNDSGTYQPVGGPIIIETSLEEEKYYIAFVHSQFGQERVATGIAPLHFCIFSQSQTNHTQVHQN